MIHYFTISMTAAIAFYNLEPLALALKEGEQPKNPRRPRRRPPRGGKLIPLPAAA